MKTKELLMGAALLFLGSLWPAEAAQQQMYEAHWRCPATAQGCIATWGLEGSQGKWTKAECDAEIAMQSGGFRNNGYPLDTECRPLSGNSGSGGGGTQRPGSAGEGIFWGTMLGGTIAGGTANLTSGNDMNRTINWGLVGGGIGMAGSGAMNAGSMHPVATGVVVGAGTYAATLGHGRNQELDGKQDTKKTQDDAVKAGAVAAGVSWGLAEVAKSVAPGVHMPKGLGIVFTGRQFWMRWLW